MSNSKFNKDKLITKINSIKNVKSIEQDCNNFKITFIDNLKLYVLIAFDNHNKFYTYLDNEIDSHTQLKYFYMYKMPHNNYKDLYDEIKRMAIETTRKVPCKSRYLKAY